MLHLMMECRCSCFPFFSFVFLSCCSCKFFLLLALTNTHAIIKTIPNVRLFSSDFSLLLFAIYLKHLHESIYSMLGILKKTVKRSGFISSDVSVSSRFALILVWKCIYEFYCLLCRRRNEFKSLCICTVAIDNFFRRF